MDFSQVYVPRSEFKDFSKSPSNQHVYADVLLIDRSPTGAFHQVYQLKSEYQSDFGNFYDIRRQFQGLDRNAFLVLGDLLEIDMANKSVLLTNRNVLTYRYLILFKDNEQPIELSTALHTLKDALLLEALNVKNRISAAPSPYTPADMKIVARTQDNNDPIDKIAQPRIPHNQNESFAVDLGSTSRSLCQVQL